GARGPYLINNTIYANPSSQGSGIFADGFDSQAQIVNNIIVAATGQTAVMCGNFDSTVPVFHTNDVFSSSGVPYGGLCASQTGLNGDISADPLFVSPDAGNLASVTASDSLSGVASLTVTASSSEPDSGTGGGDVPGDIVINGGTVVLRAERSPSGPGRTYTINATATDIVGNVVVSTVTCQVPK